MSEYASSKSRNHTIQEALILISRQTEQNKKKIFYLEQENKRLRVTMENFSNNFQQKLVELEAKTVSPKEVTLTTQNLMSDVALDATKKN